MVEKLIKAVINRLFTLKKDYTKLNERKNF